MADDIVSSLTGLCGFSRSIGPGRCVGPPGLLRARRERPPGRAAEKRDELATLHVLPSVQGLHPTTPV